MVKPRTKQECLESYFLKGRIYESWEETEFELKALSDFEFFFKHVIGQRVGEYHKKLFALLKNPRVCIMAPRGHAKTEICSVAYPIWRAWSSTEPLEIVIISGTKDQSMRVARRVKDYIETNEFLQRLKPKNKGYYWSRSEMFLEGRTRISSMPFTDTVRGNRIDICICDDLLKREMADQSPAIEKFVEIVSPACDKPNSQIIVAGTPQSHFDLFHKLSETTGYVFQKFKCCERIFKGEVEGPPLFPERFSVHQLQLKYWELGYGAFMQEMMCLEGNTDVYTPQGLKKIKDISIGDLVLGDGNFTKVLDTFKRQYEGEIIKVETRTEQPFLITPEHPVRRVKQTSSKEYDNGFYYRKGRKNKNFELEWVPAYKLTRGDLLVLPCPKIKEKELHDDEFMELMGWYISEGFSKFYDKRRAWVASIGQTRRSTLERVNELINKYFEYNGKIYGDEVYIFDKGTAAYLHHNFGGLAKDKKLPDYFFEINKKNFGYLLDSLIEGDGCNSKDNLIYLSISKNLIYQLKLILLKFGISSTISFRRNIYRLQISHHDHETINSILPYNRKNVTKIEKCRAGNSWVENDYQLIRVANVSVQPYSGEVFNLHTEDNTYALPNGLVHNCEPIQPGDVIFDYETLIKGCIDEELKNLDYAVPTYEYWLGVDIALSKERAADQSAYVVIEKRPGDKMLRLVHMQIPTKGTYTDQQFEQIKDLHRRFRFKRILIENKGNSMSLVEFLQRDQQTCGVVEQFPTTHTEKERIIMKLQKLMSNGLLEIIKDDLLIGELQQIGIKHEWRAGRSLEKIQSLGGHDDIVIAFALAVEAATSAVGQASLIWV